MARSIEKQLRRVRRELIDREFAAMRVDAAYQLESAIITWQFASNDRDTLLRAGEDLLQQ